MVEDCRDKDFLSSAYALTRSCAKANHREAWSDRTARSCGVCIPCLFRRASLHKNGLDHEVYGKKVEAIKSLADMPADVLALLTFLRRKHSDREIAAGLLGNGPLPLDKLPMYVDLVKRMRVEVLTWLRAKGSPFIKKRVARMLIDTHCHIDQFASPEDVVRECQTGGLRVVAVTNLPSHFALAADRLRKYPLVSPALGIHPLSASEGIRELVAFKRMAPPRQFHRRNRT